MSTKIEQPEAPQAPSTAEGVQAWVDSMPQVYQTQMEYAPLQAQQQLELAQQYAQPLGEAYKTAQEAMYPETAALQEQLAGQASEGMQSSVPDWMREQYLDNVRSQLGDQAASRLGGDYVSTGLLQQNQDWQNYYRDLGLSLAGRQPLAQPTSSSYSDYMSGFTPNAVMQNQATNYGNYSNLYGNMYNANSNVQSSMNQMYGNIAGQALGGASQGAGFAMMSSSKRYKKNIKLWEKH